MMDLLENLRDLSTQVEWRLPAAKRSEASTSQFLVMPFFDVLGYNVHNPNHVEPEFTADVGIQREKVDFALKQDGNPVILVEVKYAGASLDNQHAAQLRRYFSTKLEVRFGILTNGLDFRFFSDLENQNVMDDEPFLTLDLQNLDESLLHVLEEFTRTRFEKNKAIHAAQSARDRQRVRRALKAEFDPLSAGMVQYFLDQVQSNSERNQLERLIRQEWEAFLQPKLVPEPDPTIVKPPVKFANARDIPVFGYHEGHRFEAEMLRTSLANGFNGASHCIRFKGRLTNGKEAMIAAIRTVDSMFNPGEKQFGLGFWHVIDPADDTEHPLYIMSKHVIVKDEDEALRQRVLNK